MKIFQVFHLTKKKIVELYFFTKKMDLFSQLEPCLKSLPKHIY